MKKTLLPGIVGWCMGIVLAFDASACIGSDCKPCPDGFSVTKKCMTCLIWLFGCKRQVKAYL